MSQFVRKVQVTEQICPKPMRPKKTWKEHSASQRIPPSAAVCLFKFEIGLQSPLLHTPHSVLFAFDFWVCLFFLNDGPSRRGTQGRRIKQRGCKNDPTAWQRGGKSRHVAAFGRVVMSLRRRISFIFFPTGTCVALPRWDWD
jgi:hypothetical protein